MSQGGARPEFSAEDVRRIDQVASLARGNQIDDLIAMLDDPNWAVRRAVVSALAGAGPEAVGPLCQALAHQRDSEARIAATVDTLSASAGAADSALIALVDSAPIPVLADIAQILGRRRSVSGLATVIALSRHADDNVAVAAIEALGRIGGRAAVDSLVAAVNSGNFFRVFPAIEVLGRSGDPRAVSPLTALLEQPHYAAEAARALGRTGDVTAVPPLMHLVARSPGALVRLAAGALGELHRRHHERAGNSDAVEAGIVKAAADPGVVRALMRALGEGDADEQANICFLLGVVGDPSTASSLMALLDASPAVAAAAARALSAFGAQVEEQILKGLRIGGNSQKRALLPIVTGRRGASEVIQCLRDEDPDVRVMACEALGRMGVVNAVSALFPLLADADNRVALAAVAAIQSLGGAETERLASEAARSADLRVRRSALRILGYFGASASLDVILAALRDPDERVREIAVQGLPLMEDPRAFEALLAATKDPVERTRAAAMRSLGQSAGDLRASAYLLKGLSDPDAWVRYYACQSLGKVAFEPAASAIIRLLRDPAGQVRVAAIEALSCLTSELAASALKEAANDADNDIRRAAIVGLGVARHPDGLPLILDATRSNDPATRLVATSALAGFRSPEVLAAFQTVAADSDESVRTAAINFLAAMTGVAATQALISLLNRSPVVEQVMAALVLHVEGRIPGLVAALENADDELAPSLTSALARLRRPDAVAALIKAMSFPNVAARKAAASALAILPGKEGLAALRKAADDDTEPQVRQICSLLLAR